MEDIKQQDLSRSEKFFRVVDAIRTGGLSLRRVELPETATNPSSNVEQAQAKKEENNE